MFSKLTVTIFVALVGMSSLHVVSAAKKCPSTKLLYCCPNVTPVTNPCVTSDGNRCIGGKFQCCVKDNIGGGPKLETCTNPT